MRIRFADAWGRVFRRFDDIDPDELPVKVYPERWWRTDGRTIVRLG